MHILDAAERVFARFMPDEVGLRQVAEEGAISHTLITHYFGTYDAMVEAVLDRRAGAVREAVLARLRSGAVDPRELGPLPALVGMARDRLTMRLMIWAVTSGRARRPGFFAARVQGLRLVVDAIAAALAARGARVPARARLEFAVSAALAMTVGFGVAGDLLQGALGREGEVDVEALGREMSAMIRAYLESDAS